MDRFLTVKEIAQLQRCTLATVYNRIKSGALRANKGFGPITVLESDYQKYVRATMTRVQQKAG